MTSLARQRKSSRGATMVEMAVLLPVLLVIMAFCIDGFFLMYAVLRTSQGASEVARLVATDVAREAYIEGGLVSPSTSEIETAACNKIGSLSGTYATKRLSFSVLVKANVRENPPGNFWDLRGIPIIRVRAVNNASCVMCILGAFPNVEFTEVLSFEVPEGYISSGLNDDTEQNC